MPDIFKIPTHCPVCGSSASDEGDFLYCRNRSCPVQTSGSIRVWIKRLGLLHWGDSLIDKLTDPQNPRVSSIADLYSLTVEDISECSSGMKFAQKCYDVLHSNKTIGLELLLGSLNIPNLALATATDIVQFGFNTVEKILSITYEDLLKVPNIGDITARQIMDGLESRRQIIADLASVLDIKGSHSGPLTGKSFCITGSTSKPRKMIEKDIVNAGGTVKGSVGSNTTHLITNDPDTGSSKMVNAKKRGVTVISEESLYSMISSR
jgi:DNA ligase (NAD+)